MDLPHDRRGPIRRRALLGATALAWAAAPRAARAQAPAYPSRPIRLVVPYGPGSTPDIVGRQIAARLQESLGQPVIVDNRVGAGGSIGIEQVVRAAPDGYTLLLAVSNVAVAPALRKLSFDVTRDLAPVMLIVSGSYVLLASPQLPAANLEQLIALARQRPGKLTYGSFGPGSQAHLAMQMLASAAGIDLVHVPYKSLANATQAVLAGEIDLTFDATVSALPLVRAGRLKALAVGGPQPVNALPGVAPIANTFAGYDADGWEAVFAPVDTPREIVDRLNAELRRVMSHPDVATRLRDLGFEPRGSTPDELASLLRADLAKWAKVVRDNHITAD